MQPLFPFYALLVGLIGALPAAMRAQEPTPVWVAGARLDQIGDMSVARAAHQSTQLGTGEILITGGCSGRCDVNLGSAELFDPAAQAFRAAAAMAVARDSHVAVLLADGRVLVSGGWSGRQATSRAEIYLPDQDRFLETASMAVARAAPAAARLPDGRVLITGGQTSALEPLASAELFDPGSSRFALVAPMLAPRIGHVAVTLLDGRVLIIGGRQARRGEVLRTAEIFDPTTGQFEFTGNLSFARHKHAAALLPDGRVLVIGGADERDQHGRYLSTEVYDPVAGTFSMGPDMQWSRFKLPDAMLGLPSGAVLVAGGATGVEVFDPQTNLFSGIPGGLNDAMEFATASLLPSGDVLLLGGYDHDIQTSASAWLVQGLH